MKVMVIGASGTIGREVVSKLLARHDVIKVGHTKGDHTVDLGSKEAIKRLFAAVRSLDAVICAAGLAKFGPLAQLSDDDFQLSVSNKLMGQVDLVRIGIPSVSDQGSFTLTSGVLSRQPMRGSAAISLVNAGIEAFGRAAALELPRGLRLNVVSPGWVTETLKTLGMDPTGGMPAEEVAWAYVESLEGERNGETLDPKDFVR